VCPTIALFSSTTNHSPIGGPFSTAWLRLSIQARGRQTLKLKAETEFAAARTIRKSEGKFSDGQALSGARGNLASRAGDARPR
jgi:hypothetical protein